MRKKLSASAIFCMAFAGVAIVGGFGLRVVQAAWQEPAAQPPQGNIYAPLNTSAERQAKKGRLLLDPLYNPYGPLPTINYPLEVRGQKDVSINDLLIPTGGSLTVDTDTLYVDGVSGRVGFGTLTPTARLEAVGGGVSIGSATASISGTALAATSDAVYGVFGQSTSATAASIAGQGIGASGIGIYGLHANSGTGIRAESTAVSAVVGKTNAPWNPAAAVKIAGIFGKARGLGAWAGYFAQRAYSTDQAVGKKFLPSQLPNSLVPYTAGWEVRKVEKSLLTEPYKIAYANGKVWVFDYSWDGIVYVVNPINGTLEGEFTLCNAAKTLCNHGVSSVIVANGYIYVAGREGYGPNRPLVSQLTPDVNNPVVTQFPVGNIASNVSKLAVDLVYDTTTAGGPYIWTANLLFNGTTNPATSSYSVSRLKLSDGTFIEAAAIAGAQCVTLDPNFCSDRLNNDGDVIGRIDQGLCVYTVPTDQTSCQAQYGTWTAGYCADQTYSTEATCTGNGKRWIPGTCSNVKCTAQAACENATRQCGATWNTTAGTCSDPACTTQATCEGVAQCAGTWRAPDPDCTPYLDTPGTSPWNGATTDTTNERLVIRPLGAPSGITLDPSRGNVWVSEAAFAYGFGGVFTGEGLVKVNAADPANAALQNYYCTGPARDYGDITYDSINDQLWLGQSINWRKPGTFTGISKANPATGAIVAEYLRSSGFLVRDIWKIEFENVSTGGPYLWAASADVDSEMYKITSLSSVVSPSIVNTYTPPGGVYDFSFDRSTVGGPYVWGALANAGSISRSLIDAPYSTSVYSVKGTRRSGALFDGTYLWVSNLSAQSLTRYRASDGEKVGDTTLGSGPYHIIYDGEYIWSVNSNGSISKVRATDGSLVAEYGTGYGGAGESVTFDGTNIWRANPFNNHLHRVALTSCTGASGSNCTSNQTFSIAGLNPSQVVYDGASLWVSQKANTISKLSTAGAVQATYTLPGVSSVDYNVTALTFDGTYLWVGTDRVDAGGYSLYKVDTSSGVCSNSSAACSTNADCGAGTCNAVVAGKSAPYHWTGRCSDTNLSCRSDADCTAPAQCFNAATGYGAPPSFNRAGIEQLLFDGINIWAVSGRAYDYNSQVECGDGIDNDGDGKIDRNSAPSGPDVDCENTYDIHEGARCNDRQDNNSNGTCDWNGCKGLPADPACGGSQSSNAEGSPECSDALDNDGNGECDFDGAPGTPGCSGRPDPECSSAADISESNRAGYAFINRISATSGQLIEANPFGYYCGSDGLAFDGNNIWSVGGGCDDKYTIREWYAGQGRGQVDLEGVVNLQRAISASEAQTGNFAIAGMARFDADLQVIGDLVVRQNVWEGADDIRDFGTGCVEGQFAKGIDAVTNKVICRPL